MMIGERTTARLKQWVAEIRIGRRKKRLAAASVDRDQRNPAESLSRLVNLVRNTAKQIVSCLEAFRSLQTSLACGVQDFLLVDSVSLSDPTLGLVSMCLALFQECDQLLKGEALLHFSACLDHIAEDCTHISGLIQNRDEAFSELQHYENKVAWLKQQRIDTGEETGSEVLVDALHPQPGQQHRDRLLRNQDKLSRAEAIVEAHRSKWEVELRAFEERRAGHASALLLGLLRAYFGLLRDWGQQAGEAVKALDGELRAGMAVRVDGLPRSEACDCVATFEKREVKLEPPRGPCTAGCEAEVHCGGLDGPITEVIIGGRPAEVLSTTCWGARIRVPPNAATGPTRVEVRAARWQHRVAIAEAAFHYYNPIGFGPCGKNIELSTAKGVPPGAEVPKSVAIRVSGLLDGVVLTAVPLPAIPLQDLPQVVRYYFEIEVLGVAQKCTGTTRTVALGFAWPAPGKKTTQVPLVQAGCFAPTSATASTSPVQGSSARLPEMARHIQRSFVVGGDLPRVYFAGKEHSKVSSGWRPIFDVVAGTRLGALLQVQAGRAKLTILQDDVCRCTVEVELPDSQWECAPHGAVDVCGTLQRVGLRQGVEIPKAALEAACRAAYDGPASGGSAKGKTGMKKFLSVGP